ncbi:MAG: superinfection immunity protein [Acidobacteriota bacterium]
MYDIPWLSDLLWVTIPTLYGLPTFIALVKGMPRDQLLLFSTINLFLGWTVIGWFWLLKEAWSPGWWLDDDPLMEPMLGDESSAKLDPEYAFAKPIGRLMELASRDERTLWFRLADGKALALIAGGQPSLVLQPRGPWSPAQRSVAAKLLRTEVEIRPAQVRLLEEVDPLRGIAFIDKNSYTVSALVYLLITECLEVTPEDLEIRMEPEDIDSRLAIADALSRSGRAEIHHEKSGVRIQVERLGGAGGSGFRIEVPVASLDPRRGHRHRARQALTEARWRFSEDGSEAQDPLSDDEASWGYVAPRDDAEGAADIALRLICTITEEPIDLPLQVKDTPR